MHSRNMSLVEFFLLIPEESDLEFLENFEEMFPRYYTMVCDPLRGFVCTHNYGIALCSRTKSLIGVHHMYEVELP